MRVGINRGEVAITAGESVFQRGQGLLFLALSCEDRADLEIELYPRLSARGSRRMLVVPAQELMQGGGDFVGMRCAPGNNAFQLD